MKLSRKSVPLKLKQILQNLAIKDLSFSRIIELIDEKYTFAHQINVQIHVLSDNGQDIELILDLKLL